VRSAIQNAGRACGGLREAGVRSVIRNARRACGGLRKAWVRSAIKNARKACGGLREAGVRSAIKNASRATPGVGGLWLRHSNDMFRLHEYTQFLTLCRCQPNNLFKLCHTI
jgi:hypothetical protein